MQVWGFRIWLISEWRPGLSIIRPILEILHTVLHPSPWRITLLLSQKARGVTKGVHLKTPERGIGKHGGFYWSLVK